MNRRQFGLGAAASAVALTSASKALAANKIRLTIASSHPATLPWVGTMKDLVVPESNARLEAAGSETRIDWTESYGGSLYKFDKTLEAVGDGITDLGWVGTLWEESKMPLQNISFYTPFVSDDLPAMLGLVNRLHGEMPALSDAWDRQKSVFLGASGIETYHLLTKEPLDDFAGLDGKKIIAAGTVGNWLKGTGAVPVNAGLPNFYNMLKTGVADGVLIAFSGAFPFKLFEVAPYITKVGIGAQMTGGLAANKRVWRKLPEDVQGILRGLGAEYSARHAGILMSVADKFEGMMAEAGATITTLPDEERQKWIDALPDLAADWRDNSGPGAGDVLSAYLSGMEELGYASPRVWGG
ncbi:C4-dicarboxylate TRAP transporter substrate-binding protein [Ruegeria sp. HKCCD8929]|uniref:C4-dicarboxylate TRAP transporter substrate-binding protein n=1 Tax=Ruegeria sp. HKCCD8929 TaxID=2683006 RepID=UPI00148995AF|nr:C4-dicarboxylate TRAP transporter substrate-binding protein [Ruegeria sp. HKCCD8929]